jgi:hypothetical protein
MNSAQSLGCRELSLPILLNKGKTGHCADFGDRRSKTELWASITVDVVGQNTGRGNIVKESLRCDAPSLCVNAEHE